MTHRSDRSRRGHKPRPGSAGSAPAHPRADAEVGVVSYFHLNDAETVERVVAGLEDIGVKHLRTAVSWCDWETEDGPAWYRWVLDQLCSRFEVLPCVLYTPPARGILPKTSSPPRDPNDYADFVDLLLSTYPDRFEYVELWNEPNNYIEWDWTVDPEWDIFVAMISAASERARHRGVKSVLGGMSPLDLNWLNLMFLRGALDEIDVVGIHGFPRTWDVIWEGWEARVQRVQEVVSRHSSPAQVWITECGFSTWSGDELSQLRALADVRDAPVKRVYWYSAEDLDASRATLDGFHGDERAYHFGLHRRDGSPKMAARSWAAGGLARVQDISELVAGAATGGGAEALVIEAAEPVASELPSRPS